MKLLHVDSSILGDNAVAGKVSAGIVEALSRPYGDPLDALKAEHPGIEVTYRDLGGRTLAEFLAANVAVIVAPLYDFTPPSRLKAWVDPVTVAGTTFRQTAAGPKASPAAGERSSPCPAGATTARARPSRWSTGIMAPGRVRLHGHPGHRDDPRRGRRPRSRIAQRR